MHSYEKMQVSILALLLTFLLLLSNTLLTLHDDSFFERAVSTAGNGDLAKAQEVRAFALGGPEPEFLNENEALHIRDVAFRIRQAQTVLLWMGLFTVLLVVYFFAQADSFPESLHRAKRLFLGTAALTLLVSLLLAAASFNFSSFFTLFHQPLFAQGSWTFPADSPLIILFPESFFYLFFRQVLLGSLLQGVAVLVLGIFTLHSPWREQ